MKKLFFLLLAVMSAATMVAAAPVNAPKDTTGYLWNDGKDFYIGRTLLTKQECQSLLKNTCPEAFRQYDKGKKLITAGWSTFGIGLFLTATPWIPLTFDNPYRYDDERHDRFYNAKEVAMQVWLVAGCAVTASSIPMLCVGYTSRNKTANIYNYQCMNKKPDIRYMLTAGQNGVGLAVMF